MRVLCHAMRRYCTDTLDHGLATGATTPAKLLAHVQEVMDDKHPGSIIHLQHDLLADSVALVEDVVQQVRAKGYRFVTVRECVYGTRTCVGRCGARCMCVG